MAKTSSNQRKYLITDKSPFHEKFREINFRKNLTWCLICNHGCRTVFLTADNDKCGWRRWCTAKNNNNSFQNFRYKKNLIQCSTIPCRMYK